ncbi:MAG: Dam family site-specific DNA-(adenine-N6)-methyltransferase [bacterium]|nr:Dam family site-specific DNA-(adenine-N6)-methyltransferase [bacterium]
MTILSEAPSVTAPLSHVPIPGISAAEPLFPSPDPLKPPLKWAGGKRWLVEQLRTYWEPFRQRRYVEPFCGGLAVPLGLSPAQALLNDMNRHVINFYRHVQRGLALTIPTGNDRELYLSHRQRFNDLIRSGDDASAESAQLFYFLNKTGYNGLCRFNRKGEYNVPFGQYKTITYQPDFYAYQAALARWSFTSSDFADLALLPGDFVYADPPYDVPFVQYSQYGFNWADQERLAAWLADHDGPVIISNQATERIKTLYRAYGYRLIELPAPRRISCNGNRTPAVEVLAFRNITVQADGGP